MYLRAIGGWLFLKTNIFKNDVEVSNDLPNNSVSITQDSKEFIFVGEEAYLVKGKLLDENLRDVYEKLPHTLV